MQLSRSCSGAGGRWHSMPDSPCTFPCIPAPLERRACRLSCACRSGWSCRAPTRGGQLVLHSTMQMQQSRAHSRPLPTRYTWWVQTTSGGGRVCVAASLAYVLRRLGVARQLQPSGRPALGVFLPAASCKVWLAGARHLFPPVPPLRAVPALPAGRASHLPQQRVGAERGRAGCAAACSVRLCEP